MRVSLDFRSGFFFRVSLEFLQVFCRVSGFLFGFLLCFSLRVSLGFLYQSGRSADPTTSPAKKSTGRRSCAGFEFQSSPLRHTSMVRERPRYSIIMYIHDRYNTSIPYRTMCILSFFGSNLYLKLIVDWLCLSVAPRDMLVDPFQKGSPYLLGNPLWRHHWGIRNPGRIHANPGRNSKQSTKTTIKSINIIPMAHRSWCMAPVNFTLKLRWISPWQKWPVMFRSSIRSRTRRSDRGGPKLDGLNMICGFLNGNQGEKTRIENTWWKKAMFLSWFGSISWHYSFWRKQWSNTGWWFGCHFYFSH